MRYSQIQPNTFGSEHLRLNKMLDECLYTLFPNQEFINVNLQNITSIQKNLNFYKKNFLPFHTRDTFWLSKYLEQSFNQMQALKKFRSEKIHVGVVSGYIKKYVESSPKFDAVRSFYEQNLVRAYINMTLNYKADDFFSKGTIKTQEHRALNYNQLFRERIVNAMSFLGVDRNSIEVGLEANASLWREKVNKQTFYNIYNIDNMDAIVNPDGLLAKHAPMRRNKLMSVGNKLYGRWKNLQDYEYYQEHKQVIDQLGVVTPAMLLTTEKATKLQNDVDSMAFEYECILCNAAECVATIINQKKEIERDITQELK